MTIGGISMLGTRVPTSVYWLTGFAGDTPGWMPPVKSKTPVPFAVML